MGRTQKAVIEKSTCDSCGRVGCWKVNHLKPRKDNSGKTTFEEVFYCDHCERSLDRRLRILAQDVQPKALQTHIFNRLRGREHGQPASL